MAEREREKNGASKRAAEGGEGASRRAAEGGEGARGRRKRIAAHNSVRRPAIRFVLDVSNRLARRSRERETVVHVFTFARQLR